MELLLNLAIFLPLVGAIIVAIVRNEQFAKVFSITLSGIVVLITLVLYINFDFSKPGFQYETYVPWIKLLGIGYHVGVDGMAITLILMTAILFFAAFIWSWKIEDRPIPYIALFLSLETACIGVFAALDLFLFYLFWEGMLIPMYFIIGFWGHDRKVYAANKFFLYTFFGSLFLLLGIASILVYGYLETGKLSFDYFFHLKLDYPIWLELVAFLLFGLGFAVKIPMWPFHTWLPDAHVEAPTAGSVILAGVLLKMGTYGFVRFSLPLFPEASKYYIPIIFTLSVIAIIYAAMMAIAQTHMKRLIAYSSISHMGLVTLGTFALNHDALNGAIYLMIAHGLSSAALFFGAGFIYDRIHSYHLDDLGGLAKYIPYFTLAFFLAILSGIAFPGFASFVSELLILLGTFKDHPIWAFIAGIGMVLGAAYSLYMFWKVMLEEDSIPEERKERWKKLKDIELHHAISFALIIAMALIMGIYPYPFVKIVEHTAKFVFGG